MGNAYDHRQTIGAPSVAHAPSGSPDVGAGPLEGNASRQQQLPQGEEACAAPGLDPETTLAAEYLLDCVRQLWEARVNGADDAWEMVKDEGENDWTVDIVTIGISAALVSAATAVSGGVLAAVVGSVGPAARKVLEDFLAGAGGSLVDAGTAAAVEAVVTDQRGYGASSSDAYFVGIKAGLRSQSVSDVARWRGAAARVGAQPDGAAELRTSAQSLLQQMATAESIQVRASVVEWMNVLAKVDTGRGESEEGSDLSKAGTGRSLLDEAISRHPRGVLNIHTRPTSPVWDGEIMSATISGITDKMLATLSASGQPALELGIPIFVTGVVNDGVIEIGRNERGSMMIRCKGTGDGFLETLDSEGVDREDGAQRLLAWAAGRSLTELQVERDGWF